MTYLKSKLNELASYQNGVLSSGTPFYLSYNSGNVNFPNSTSGTGIVLGVTGTCTIDGTSYTGWSAIGGGAATQFISFSSSVSLSSGMAWGIKTSSYTTKIGFSSSLGTSYNPGNTSSWTTLETTSTVRILTTAYMFAGDRVGWSSYPQNRGWNWGLLINGSDTGNTDFVPVNYGFGWSSQTGKNEYAVYSLMLPYRGTLKYYCYTSNSDGNYPLSASLYAKTIPT